MELERDLDLPALLWRSAIDEERFAAAVVLRQTFDLGSDTLRPATEQCWQASAGPWDSPQGPHAGDGLFYRGGVDLLCFGSARAPGGEPAATWELGFQVGDWSRRLRVLGPRVWNRHWGRKLLPSEPQPVDAVPLALDQAYGGCDEIDGVQVPYPDNPLGRGWAASAESAAGRMLPGFEDPEQPLRHWDEPVPVLGFGFCPLPSGARLRRGTRFSEQGQLRELRASLFNEAWDGMILPSAQAGMRLRIDGLRADRPLSFVLPPPPARIALQFGDREELRDPAIDQIGIESEEGRVFIAWRYPFRYRMTPLQRRRCRLVAAESSSSGRKRDL